MGGAVRGGDLLWQLPGAGREERQQQQFRLQPNQVGNGALLPETSVDQLGATLGRWFGLSDGQLLDLFPNLANYKPASATWAS